MAWIQTGKTITKRWGYAEYMNRAVAKGHITKRQAAKNIKAFNARVKKNPVLGTYGPPLKGSKLLKKLPKNLKGFIVKR